jgi:hypothetical protein
MSMANNIKPSIRRWLGESGKMSEYPDPSDFTLPSAVARIHIGWMKYLLLKSGTPMAYPKARRHAVRRVVYTA